MQQTTKYKLNLIEKTDTFSPDPLNENMQKVESAIATETAAGDAAEAAARRSADNALDQRVKVLEARRIVAGTYTGNGVSGQTGQTINLGFTPAIVLVAISSGITYMAAKERQYTTALAVVENGFKVLNASIGITLNGDGAIYGFLAVL